MQIHPATRNFLRLLVRFLPKSAFPYFSHSDSRAIPRQPGAAAPGGGVGWGDRGMWKQHGGSKQVIPCLDLSVLYFS